VNEANRGGAQVASGRGRPSCLSKHDKARLVAMLARGARAIGPADDRWTVPRVADLIAFHFGVPGATGGKCTVRLPKGLPQPLCV
jgi:transposase